MANGMENLPQRAARNYRGTPEVLMRFARAQTLAGLLKLQGDGMALPVDGDRWRRA